MSHVGSFTIYDRHRMASHRGLLLPQTEQWCLGNGENVLIETILPKEAAKCSQLSRLVLSYTVCRFRARCRSSRLSLLIESTVALFGLDAFKNRCLHLVISVESSESMPLALIPRSLGVQVGSEGMVQFFAAKALEIIRDSEVSSASLRMEDCSCAGTAASPPMCTPAGTQPAYDAA